ncbi:MAG: mechanosensitive ion channel protein MscS [Planctomycetota bacterium]|nr:MAG: mechanosensitive ion channel protein MscS [Planctomycetota bacterium]
MQTKDIGAVEEFFKNQNVVDSIKTIIIIFSALIAFVVSKKVILKIIEKITQKTKSNWDNVLFEQKVFNRFAYLSPAIILYLFADKITFNFLDADLVQKLLITYMAIVVLLTIDKVLNSFIEIYRSFEVSKRVPVKGYIQLLKIFLYIIGSIMIIANLLDKSPTTLLSGIGALTAVLMLVFKNSILSLVANIQITSNKLIKIGDWLEIKRFGADGDVIEIALNYIRIQNWDKTISVVPMHLMLEEAYKNWSGMTNSGGRRIKRSIHLDINSIKLCDEKMIERFNKINLLNDYMAKKIDDIKNENDSSEFDNTLLVNGRHLTNIGTYRAYIQAYLAANPSIHKDMTFLVRQLAPDEKGLPIELYIFSNNINWVAYEGIQADIFDHLLAVAPEFDLRIYQSPAGNDFNKLVSQ